MKLLAPYSEVEYTDLMSNRPHDDDLERVNCPQAGQNGHFYCGVCNVCRLAQFACVCSERHIRQLPLAIDNDPDRVIHN